LIAYRVKEDKSYSAFFRDRFARDGVRSLYRGVHINMLRQGVIWSTVMGLNGEVKRRFDLFDTERRHPYVRQGVTSVLIAGGLVTWALPIDFVKSRIQMDPAL
jgi:hypothetical protein